MVTPFVPIRAGSTLSPKERRFHCAKCGKRLIFPTSILDILGGYCGECKHLLRLKYSAIYDLEPVGYPKNGDFKNRLKDEPELFFAKPVEKWYEPEPGPSDMWKQKMAEAERFNKRLP